MFAKRKVNKKTSLRDHSGLGGLAAYVLTPSPTKASQVDIEPSLDVHRYQKGLEPSSPPKPTHAGVKELLYSSSSSTHTNATESSWSSVPPARLNRTGDKTSFTLSDHDNVYIDRKASRRAYRVVSYKTTKSGQRKVFDIVDGKTYHCGAGMQRRITENAVVFASKQEALSERFPSNQYDATKGGNGYHPRMLLAFDVWGHCKARHGGVPSMVCEYVRFMGVVEYLDAPSSNVSRLVCRNDFPFNFPGADKTKPQRESVDKDIKIYHMFNYLKIGAHKTEKKDGVR